MTAAASRNRASGLHLPPPPVPRAAWPSPRATRTPGSRTEPLATSKGSRRPRLDLPTATPRPAARPASAARGRHRPFRSASPTRPQYVWHNQASAPRYRGANLHTHTRTHTRTPTHCSIAAGRARATDLDVFPLGVPQALEAAAASNIRVFRMFASLWGASWPTAAPLVATRAASPPTQADVCSPAACCVPALPVQHSAHRFVATTRLVVSRSRARRAANHTITPS